MYSTQDTVATRCKTGGENIVVGYIMKMRASYVCQMFRGDYHSLGMGLMERGLVKGI